jgi:hypothetical protein
LKPKPANKTINLARTANKVLLSALEDERLDAKRWKPMEPSVYTSVIAGAFIDYAVMLVESLVELEEFGSLAKDFMIATLHQRLDTTAQLKGGMPKADKE